MCRRSNAAVYLTAVAVTDLAALYTGLLRQVIFKATGRDIREERYVHACPLTLFWRDPPPSPPLPPLHFYVLA